MLSQEPTIEKDVVLKKVRLGRYTQVKSHSTLHDVTMGDYSYCAGYNQMDYAKIGKFCSIASFVRINPGNHPTYTRVAQHHFTYRSALFGFGKDDDSFFDWRKHAAVTIGHDVWIGHNAIIMPGVTVGNGAVIGAGAIVTKNVAPYFIVVGVPAQPIGMRFEEKLIEKIEDARWWDWDHATIAERMDDFRDMKAFVRKYL